MRLTTAALVLAVAASGCGTTVHLAQGAGKGATDASGLNLQLPGTTTPGGSVGSPGTTAAGGTNGASTSTTSGGIADGSTSDTGTSGSGGVSYPTTTSVPGVSKDSITIGISYTANAGAFNSALGGRGITTGNEPVDARIVIDDLNKHGGLLGHKIVPLFFQRDAQSTAPVANQAQTECAYYTQDHKIFAALVGNGPVDWALKPCLNKAGVPAITSHIVSLDDGDPRLTWNVDVAGMSEMSLATAQLEAIGSQKWLSGWNSTTGAAGPTPAVVGLISYDLPAVNRAVQQVLLPGLQQLGKTVDPKNIYRIALPQGTSDNAAAEAALQSAVLKLRSNNVDHLVVVDNGGAMTLLLANNLYSQGYFPRLAGTSSNGFQALLSGGSIQPQVMRGMVGAGWEPVIDLPFSDKGATPRRASCLKLMRAGSQSFSDANSEAVALGYCDKLRFLANSMTVAGTLTPAAYLSAIDRVGAFETARGLGSYFASGRHNGGSAFQDMVFSSGCSCVAYAGSVRSVH